MKAWRKSQQGRAAKRKQMARLENLCHEGKELTFLKELARKDARRCGGWVRYNIATGVK